MTCVACVVPCKVKFFETFNNNSKFKYQELTLLYQAQHTRLNIMTL
jgi:hypothetical protein